MTISNDNGWEMWRKLSAMYEPNLVVKQAQYMAQFTGMVNKKAKNMRETRAFLMEMEEKAKKVEEVLGKPIEAGHAASVIAGILDSETLKHILQTPGIMTKPTDMKRRAMEFIVMMSDGEDKDPKKKDLGSLDEDKGEQEEENKDWEQWESLYGFGEKCYECGKSGTTQGNAPVRERAREEGKVREKEKGNSGREAKGREVKGRARSGREGRARSGRVVMEKPRAKAKVVGRETVATLAEANTTRQTARKQLKEAYGC